MYKLSAKKLLLIGGIVALMLAAFLAGGIAMSSVQAAGAHGPDKKTMQSKDGSRNQPGSQVKGVGTITAVSGNKIQVTVLLSSLDNAGSTVTIITTSSTTYQPDQSIVAVGKTVTVFGTLNSDRSITAQSLSFYDPTIARFGGVITNINGSTVTVQVKDSTHTILLTAATTFIKVVVNGTKTTQPASQSDLNVGTIIEAQGKLNSDGSLTASTVLIEPAGTGHK